MTEENDYSTQDEANELTDDGKQMQILFDEVKHPSGYQLTETLQLKDVLPTLLAKFKGITAFYVGNVLKYTIRYQQKNGIQDLEKAKQYLDMLIDLEKEKQNQ